ncbi:MAG: CsgG/HfaB family protein, partial [Phycisphaerales bacterium]
AIRAIAATPAVQAQAKSEGTDNALMQVEQGADPQLLDAIQATRRFDLVARSDMPSVMKEQDLTQSGNVNVMDPQAARAFQLAGARYVATVTIGNFQDISERTELLNQFGTSKAERRTIDLQATVKIFDTTTGTLFRSTTVTISEAATNEIMPGVEQKGSKTNVVLGQAAARLAREAAANIADSISPARVVGYTMGKITFNRSADQGVAAGQVYEVFSMGESMVDPDTGEQLGAEEVSVGWARVLDAGSRVSTAQAIEDRGIDRGSVLRLRPDGLPAGVNPDGKSTGSAAGGAAAPRGPATAPPVAPGAPGSPASGAARRTRRLGVRAGPPTASGDLRQAAPGLHSRGEGAGLRGPGDGGGQRSLDRDHPPRGRGERGEPLRARRGQRRHGGPRCRDRRPTALRPHVGVAAGGADGRGPGPHRVHLSAADGEAPAG